MRLAYSGWAGPRAGADPRPRSATPAPRRPGPPGPGLSTCRRNQFHRAEPLAETEPRLASRCARGGHRSRRLQCGGTYRGAPALVRPAALSALRSDHGSLRSAAPPPGPSPRPQNHRRTSQIRKTQPASSGRTAAGPRMLAASASTPRASRLKRQRGAGPARPRRTRRPGRIFAEFRSTARLQRVTKLRPHHDWPPPRTASQSES